MQKRTGTLPTTGVSPLVFPGRVGYNFKKERKRVTPITRRLAWALACVLLLSGCGGGKQEVEQHYTLGETISTAWFDYTVSDVTSTEQYGGYILSLIHIS